MQWVASTLHTTSEHGVSTLCVCVCVCVDRVCRLQLKYDATR